MNYLENMNENKEFMKSLAELAEVYIPMFNRELLSFMDKEKISIVDKSNIIFRRNKPVNDNLSLETISTKNGIVYACSYISSMRRKILRIKILDMLNDFKSEMFNRFPTVKQFTVQYNDNMYIIAIDDSHNIIVSNIGDTVVTNNSGTTVNYGSRPWITVDKNKENIEYDFTPYTMYSVTWHKNEKISTFNSSVRIHRSSVGYYQKNYWFESITNFSKEYMYSKFDEDSFRHYYVAHICDLYNFIITNDIDMEELSVDDVLLINMYLRTTKGN